MAKIVWNSMAGDALGKVVHTIKGDLNWWLDSQMLVQNVEKVIESTAQDIPVRLKINSEQGYPISSKCNFTRNLLEQESSHRVFLLLDYLVMGSHV